MSLALARALIVSDLVPRARMGRFLALAVRQARSLAVVLAEEDEELVLAALGKDATPLVPEFEIDRALLARLPHDLPERLGLAPLVGYSEADLVAVAMMDPTDRNAALEVERILQTSIMRVRVRPLLLRKALMEIGASQRPPVRAPEPSNQPHYEPSRSFEPQSAARLGPGEYRLEHPGFALLGMPVVRDAAESAAPPAIRTPPFGSRSVPILADLDGDDLDDEPIPLVRKASSPDAAPHTEPVSSPFSVRHARTLAPPPSMSAPPPSFSGGVPPEMQRLPSRPAPPPGVQPEPPRSVRLAPTPPGVPVTMTSPGSSVVNVEMYSMSTGMPKIIDAVVVCS